MLKFIIILILLIYILNKVSNLIFRVAGHKQTPPNFRRPVNHTPPPPPKQKKSSISGGEYVDYEEVK